jgi:hydroxyisourate hydrolase
MRAAAGWPAIRDAIEGLAAPIGRRLKPCEGTRLAGVTTHVLDVTIGRPAQGVRVELYELEGGSERKLVSDVVTNADGRTDQPLVAADQAHPGRFELIFHVGDYFRSRLVQLADPPFLDIVPIRFGVADAKAHYHVPLIVSPWSYSTYRGS